MDNPLPGTDLKPLIAIDDFAKLDLRVGQILAAEEIPGADKLLKLTVDIGETRTVVAGIKLHYRPEELIGKKIALVSNLAPRVLRGVESQGMILAASQGGALRLLIVDGDMPVGAGIR